VDDIIEVLASVELFDGLSQDDLKSIAARCRRDNYLQNQTIFSHEDRSADVYFIKSGFVLITMFSPNGREIDFRQLGTGSMFGEISAIDRQPRSTSAVSRSAVELIRMSESDFLSVLNDMPNVGLKVMQRLTFLVRALSERVFEYTTYHVRQRIHAELLRLVEAHSHGGDTVNIYPAPTHADIANRVSTHREAVTRELRILAKEGILEKRGRNLIIRNVERLEQLAAEADS